MVSMVHRRQGTSNQKKKDTELACFSPQEFTKVFNSKFHMKPMLTNRGGSAGSAMGNSELNTLYIIAGDECYWS
jgi:hypothetical protein